jgi:hypothetical protein
MHHHTLFQPLGTYASNRYGADAPHCDCAGLDFYVVLERPGYRVKRRRKCKSKVGAQHRLTKEDAIKWFQQKCVHESIVCFGM